MYSPYNANDEPVLATPSSGGMRWGAGGATSQTTTTNVSSLSGGPGGSTYNITNNNIIQEYSIYGNGSVPTFHDLDKKKK